MYCSQGNQQPAKCINELWLHACACIEIPKSHGYVLQHTYKILRYLPGPVCWPATES